VVTALDASAAALAIARENATANQVRVTLLESDWYALPRDERFAVIASNPPYIVAGMCTLAGRPAFRTGRCADRPR
jgi:release factor glutamine methyltransferase